MEQPRQHSAPPRIIAGAWHRLTQALFPPLCPVCRTETATPQSLCQECWQDVFFLTGRGCTTCGRAVAGLDAANDPFTCDHCNRLKPRWTEGSGILAYQGAGRRLVLGLKHGDRLDTLPMLADWMTRTRQGLITSADFVTPIPIHWTRRLKRKANQSAELARVLCQRTHHQRKFAPNLLSRSRRTATQDGKNRDQRVENVKDAITANPRAASKIVGKEILLIDDVMTTGATLNVAADALLQAGAARVNVLVIALVLTAEHPYVGAQQNDDQRGQAPDLIDKEHAPWRP